MKYIYIYIYIFGGFSSSWNERKKNDVKKKKCSETETGGATAHLSHDTRNSIVTHQSWAQQQGP